MRQIKRLQIGKNGLTESFIEQTKSIFKDVESIRISILKSACRDKEKAKEIAEKLIDKLGENFTYKIIGYTLVLQKWRKAKR